MSDLMRNCLLIQDKFSDRECMSEDEWGSKQLTGNQAKLTLTSILKVIQVSVNTKLKGEIMTYVQSQNEINIRGTYQHAMYKSTSRVQINIRGTNQHPELKSTCDSQINIRGTNQYSLLLQHPRSRFIPTCYPSQYGLTAKQLGNYISSPFTK